MQEGGSGGVGHVIFVLGTVRDLTLEEEGALSAAVTPDSS